MANHEQEPSESKKAKATPKPKPEKRKAASDDEDELVSDTVAQQGVSIRNILVVLCV